MSSEIDRGSLEPRQEVFERFLAEEDGRPITMLNLLRFKGEKGRATYREYVDLVTPLIEQLGGRVIYAGDFSSPLVPESSSGWDAILLAQYPRRSTLVELSTNSEYREKMVHLREESLQDTVLETTVSW